MRALVLHGIGDHRLEQVPLPQPEPGQVLLRIGYCGVCGSDIPRIFFKGTYRFPTICGHEFSGTVHSVGKGVTRFRPGDRVGVFPLLWCGKCPLCEQGKYTQCVDYGYLGSRDDGAFAEFVVAPVRNLIPIPETVTLEEASMLEPASVALHAVRRAGGASVGETVALFGAGPIGLMAAQWARLMGASQILLFDIVSEKLDLARRCGFRDSYNSTEVDPVETVMERTKGRGAHVTIDSAGCPPTLLQSLAAVRREGRVVFLGNPSADVTLPGNLISQLMRREVRIFGTWNSDFSPVREDDDWHVALQAIAGKRLELEPLISHRVNLEEGLEVLEQMRDRNGFFSKVLIHP